MTGSPPHRVAASLVGIRNQEARHGSDRDRPGQLRDRRQLAGHPADGDRAGTAGPAEPAEDRLADANHDLVVGDDAADAAPGCGGGGQDADGREHLDRDRERFERPVGHRDRFGLRVEREPAGHLPGRCATAGLGRLRRHLVARRHRFVPRGRGRRERRLQHPHRRRHRRRPPLAHGEVRRGQRGLGDRHARRNRLHRRRRQRTDDHRRIDRRRCEPEDRCHGRPDRREHRQQHHADRARQPDVVLRRPRRRRGRGPRIRSDAGPAGALSSQGRLGERPADQRLRRPRRLGQRHHGDASRVGRQGQHGIADHDAAEQQHQRPHPGRLPDPAEGRPEQRRDPVRRAGRHRHHRQGEGTRRRAEQRPRPADQGLGVRHREQHGPAADRRLTGPLA